MDQTIIARAKFLAKATKKHLDSAGADTTLSKCQEAVARALGYNDWHHLQRDRDRTRPASAAGMATDPQIATNLAGALALAGAVPRAMAVMAASAAVAGWTGRGRNTSDLNIKGDHQLLEKLIREAIEVRASDVHIEQRERSHAIYMRIDGVRRLMFEGERNTHDTLLAQLKLRAGMCAHMQGGAQDGHFEISLAGRSIDLRVATFRTANGEQAIIRIRDPHSLKAKLKDFGITRLDRWLSGIGNQTGMVLITGGVGSATREVVNATLRGLLEEGRAIYKPADGEFLMPITSRHTPEYRFISSIRQPQDARSNIIYAGELMNAEMAFNAVGAASAGNLVIATLHTASILSSISRLHDLGIKPHQLRDTLRAVMAKTLVRQTCRDCLGSGHSDGGTCRSCSGSGYRGRTMTSECHAFDTPTDVDAALELAGKKDLESVALPWVEMIDDAIIKAKAGQTTFDEVRRVFGSLADHRIAGDG